MKRERDEILITKDLKDTIKIPNKLPDKNKTGYNPPPPGDGPEGPFDPPPPRPKKE